jgi:hypothetical protein
LEIKKLKKNKMKIILLTIAVFAITLSSISHSQYIDYSEDLNGVYVEEYNGTSDYNDLQISSSSVPSEPFKAVLGSCYNSEGSRSCETVQKRVFIGGRDGDETFVEINEDNAYSIWFEIEDEDTVCFISYDYENPTRYVLDRNSKGITNSEENYEALGSSEEGKMIAIFMYIEMGDFLYFVFEDKEGLEWDFGMGDNNTGEYNFGEYEANPDLVGSEFVIEWKKEILKTTDMNGNNEDTIEVLSIKSIHLN